MKSKKVLFLAIFLLFNLSAKDLPKVFLKGDTTKEHRKSSTPIDIKYQTQKVDPAEESLVEIEFKTPIDIESANLTIKMDENLKMVDNIPLKQKITFKDRSYKMRFKVISNRMGTHYIRAIVEIDNFGFRAFAIPVTVGNSPNMTAAKKSSNPDSGLKILPADEEIIEK